MYNARNNYNTNNFSNYNEKKENSPYMFLMGITNAEAQRKLTLSAVGREPFSFCVWDIYGDRPRLVVKLPLSTGTRLTIIEILRSLLKCKVAKRTTLSQLGSSASTIAGQPYSKWTFERDDDGIISITVSRRVDTGRTNIRFANASDRLLWTTPVKFLLRDEGNITINDVIPNDAVSSESGCKVLIELLEHAVPMAVTASRYSGLAIDRPRERPNLNAPQLNEPFAHEIYNDEWF